MKSPCLASRKSKKARISRRCQPPLFVGHSQPISPPKSSWSWAARMPFLISFRDFLFLSKHLASFSGLSSLKRAWMGEYGPQGNENQISLGLCFLIMALSSSTPFWVERSKAGSPIRMADLPWSRKVWVKRLSGGQHTSIKSKREMWVKNSS